MDVIKRIKELRDKRGWSTNQLALEAELTQSTVSTLLTKESSLPSLDTLTHLCDAFGTTLAQFFMEEEQSELVSTQEKILIEQYRKLPDKKKKQCGHCRKIKTGGRGSSVRLFFCMRGKISPPPASPSPKGKGIKMWGRLTLPRVL